MSVPLAEVLEGIVGAPVGNVEFSFGFGSGASYVDSDNKEVSEIQMTHGRYQVSVKFNCSEDLFIGADYKYGSLIIGIQERIDYKLYKYTAILTKGKETEAIAEAVYRSLKAN